MEENKEPSLEEKLIQIYETLKDKSKCPWWSEKSEWKDVEDEIEKNLIDFKGKWLDDKYLLKEKAFAEIKNYYKDLPNSIEKIPIGSAGLKGLQIGFYFGNDNTLTDETIKNKFETVCAAKRTVLNSCLNAGTSADLSKENDFSAWAFLMKLLVCVNYKQAIDKQKDINFNYFFYYKKDEITKMYKQFVNGNEKDFVKQNAAIFKKGCEILSKEGIDSNSDPKKNLKGALRLSIALVYLFKAPAFDELSEESPNIIYYGAPGTGKTHAVKNIIDLVCQGDSNRYVWTQFHPNFSYEDFIDGIKPVGITNGNVKLELLNGLFKDLCIRAKNDIKHEYYFIADEINRANLSAVFGETLSLLEASYRDDPEKDNRNNLIKTQYSKVESKLIEDKIIDEKSAYEYDEEQGARFGIPKNIRFIGMMNDVDKSIDAFDLALRRRFKWIRKDCDYNVIKETVKDKIGNIDESSLENYITSCKLLNNFISVKENGLKLGKSYEFGHSFFMKISDIVENNKNDDANKITDNNKKTLFDNYLSPTLKEYLRSSCSEEEIDAKHKKAKEAFVKEQEKPGGKDQPMNPSVPQTM